MEESLLANMGTIEIDNVVTWWSVDEVDGSRGSLFGERETISLPPDIKFCPSPSSVLKILAEEYILSTEYEVIGGNLQLIFYSQERYIERDHLQVKGHLGE
jgi:hypothetical protein